MRGAAAIIVLALLLAMLFLPVARGQSQGGFKRSTWVLLPAVVEGLNGALGGALVNATVTLEYPGTGQVLVFNGTGIVTGSTLYSFEMAFAVAMTYAGLYWKDYNLIVHLNTSGPVSGPSGSFAVMLATYALATGLSTSPLHRYAITGAVSPSGLSGPIGGLEYKCEAAAGGNVGIVYPVGNLYSGEEYCSNIPSVPAAGIVNALEGLFGLTPPSVAMPNVSVSAFENVMREVSEEFANYTDKIIGLVRNSLSSVNNEVLAYEIASYLNQSETYLGYAEEYLVSLPYASASYAYAAYTYALSANYTVWAYRATADGASPSTFFKGQASNVSSYDQELLANISSAQREDASLPYYEMLATAAARLADSLYYANYAAVTSEDLSGNVSELYVPASYMAVAKARVLSALGWLKAAYAEENGSPIITEPLLSSTASALLGYTNITVNYANSLIEYYAAQFEQIGDTAAADKLIAMENDLQYLLSLGWSLLNESNFVGALGVFEDAITNALQVIFIEQTSSFSSQQVINAYAQELQHEYALVSAALSLRGLPTYIDEAYMSYARTLMSSDPQSAIYIMETAVVDSLSWYLGSLAYSASLTSPSNLTVVQVPSALVTEEGGMYMAVVFVSAAFGALVAAAVALWSYKRALR